MDNKYTIKDHLNATWYLPIGFLFYGLKYKQCLKLAKEGEISETEKPEESELEKNLVDVSK